MGPGGAGLRSFRTDWRRGLEIEVARRDTAVDVGARAPSAPRRCCARLLPHGRKWRGSGARRRCIAGRVFAHRGQESRVPGHQSPQQIEVSSLVPEIYLFGVQQVC